MSNSKYDWETKLPKMIELYKTGISIPEIYKLYNHCYCTCYARCRYARCTDP